jgi:mono/diheme cytochrome c family protein
MKILPAPDVGRRIFNQKGCIGCHSIGGTGGNVGPDLADVAKRRTTDWIVDHFRDPAAESPGTVMPKFNFSESEIRALTAFLVSLGETDIGGFWRDNPQASPEVRGRSVYRKYGCGGCHGPDGKGGVPNPNAAPDERIPPLMTEADLADIFIESFILDGVTDIAKLNPEGPNPPLYMPAWDEKISEAELADLISYLHTLAPE